MNIIDAIGSGIGSFISSILSAIPLIIVAIVIWWLGNWLIDLAVKGLKKLDIKKWNIDDKLRDIIIRVMVPIAKVLLVLVILDYLGIGEQVLAAIANGLTFTIAIALGLAFGRALEPEARNIVDRTKSHTGTSSNK